jgi:hypothetical protein
MKMKVRILTNPAQISEKEIGRLRLFQCQSGVFTRSVRGFDVSDTGISPAIILPDQPSALDIFLLFFPAEIMQVITDETNKYYRFLIQKIPPTPKSRLQQWKDTAPEEFYMFFA